MEKIAIAARNNLNVPIRLTLTNVGYKHEDSRILITIGKEGATLKDYYRVCLDVDILPNDDWQEIGLLHIDTKTKVNFEGGEKE